MARLWLILFDISWTLFTIVYYYYCLLLFLIGGKGCSKKLLLRQVSGGRSLERANAASARVRLIFVAVCSSVYHT